MPWTDTDLAYAAGLFDGEGSVHVSNYQCLIVRVKGRGVTISLQMKMATQACVAWMARTFGGAFSTYKNPYGDVYSWKLSGKAAIPVMEALAGFTKLKTAQLELAIRFQNTLQYKGRRNVPNEVLALRLTLANAIKALNGKQARDSEIEVGGSYFNLGHTPGDSGYVVDRKEIN